MTEHQPYDVLREHPGFELRRYPDHVVAETRVTGSFEGVGNSSFRRLVAYIGGRNTRSLKVAGAGHATCTTSTPAASETRWTQPASRSPGRRGSRGTTLRGRRGSCGATRSSAGRGSP